jgi:hypothetical protein
MDAINLLPLQRYAKVTSSVIRLWRVDGETGLNWP